MHCNLRPPEPRQSFPALITTPCQVWSRGTYPLPYYSVFAAHNHFTLWPRHMTLWAWPLTSDLEYLQRIACDVMKLLPNLNAIEQSAAELLRIPLVFDLMTLNIALSVALGSGIIFTKFDLRQLICAWIIAFLMLIRYVTLWSWPLTYWPWTTIALQVSCV